MRWNSACTFSPSFATVSNVKWSCNRAFHNISSLLSEVTTEELDDYVRRLNDYLSGMTTSEKEAAVRDLITKTPARVRPGVRNLPVDVYEEGEAIPPVRDIDDEGHPTLDTEEETVVFKRGEPRQTTKRKGDISMPSTSALLPDPHTDTESSHSSGSKRRTPDSVRIYPCSFQTS